MEKQIVADPPLSAIEVIGECLDWGRQAPDLSAQIKIAARAALHAEDRRGAITILLADSAHVQALNLRFRGLDAPTNVLSFPAGGEDVQAVELTGLPSLGDIILSFETVLFEATAQNKSFTDHAIHLVVHGMLHILGYDHQNEQQTTLMTNREIKILAGLDIPDPFAQGSEYAEAGHSHG